MTRPTVAQMLSFATSELTRAGVDTSELDAELLLAHALGVQRAWLLAHPEHPLSPQQETTFRALLARRAAREPLAYITGRRWFYDIELYISPQTLIPRPETEELVERALGWLQKRPRAIAADIGAGSGAIALVLAKHAPPDACIYATDISAGALEVARQNARRLGLSHRVIFLQGDLLTPLPQPVDLLLANLPYVAQRDAATLAPEVAQYEPAQALFGGPAGLDLIERLIAQAPSRLRPHGVILLEIGHDQGRAVMALARRQFPRARIRIHKDLSGRDRILEITSAS